MTEFDILITDSLEKILPDGTPRPLTDTTFKVWPGEVVSFQVACRVTANDSWPPVRPKVFLEGEAADAVRIRRVKLVPVLLATYFDGDDHYITKHAAMLPDALIPLGDGEDPTFACMAGQWDAFWCDLPVGESDAGKEKKLTVVVKDPEGQELLRQELTIAVQKDTLPAQTLLYTRWFHADCLADYYNVPAWSEEHWTIVENYVRSASQLGINMLLTPLFTPALDTAVGGERTTVQLVGVTVTDGVYSFDFTLLERWIKLLDKYGIHELEMCHLFTQWGAAAAPKVMATVDGEYKRIFGWDTPSVGGEYTKFLRTFLPALKECLTKVDMLEHAWFHVSDEPEEENLAQWSAARNSVADLLEDCHMLDALTSVSFYEQGIIKTPVPSNNHIEPFVDAKVPGLWTYYCAGQYNEVSNTFIAMPSARNRIMGTLLYRYDLAGFLQWGFNFYNSVDSLYHIDPWQTTDSFGVWPAGDPFIVYPAPDGTAWDSIRGMVFREALQDLRLLRLAQSKLGRDAVLKLLEDCWDGKMMTMKSYPRDPEWFNLLRDKLVALL